MMLLLIVCSYRCCLLFRFCSSLLLRCSCVWVSCFFLLVRWGSSCYFVLLVAFAAGARICCFTVVLVCCCLVFCCVNFEKSFVLSYRKWSLERAMDSYKSSIVTCCVVVVAWVLSRLMCFCRFCVWYLSPLCLLLVTFLLPIGVNWYRWWCLKSCCASCNVVYLFLLFYLNLIPFELSFIFLGSFLITFSFWFRCRFLCTF